MNQQHQQSYGGYTPFYPAYPQTPYMGPNASQGHNTSGHGGYPPFYGPPQPQPPQLAPQNSNPPQPAPYQFDAEAYAVKPNASGSSGQRRHRRHNTVPSQHPPPQPPQNQTFTVGPTAQNGPPLKPALKKTKTVFNKAENSTRQFFSAFNSQQPQGQQPPMTMPRTRVYSNPGNTQSVVVEEPPVQTTDNPFHMIVSFHAYNELHIENILANALEEMQLIIWPLWPEGIESDIVVEHTSIVKFRGAPWDLNGPNVKFSYKLITEFFLLFQRRGYSYQTAVNIGTSTPRLLFQVTKPDDSEFFLAFFSQEGRRLTLINPPQHIDLSMGARLRSSFGKKIQSDNVVEEYMRVIDLKRRPNSNVSEVDPGMFFVEVLRILSQLGFSLDASIPLGRRGTLGKRSQRELLVFKGNIVRDA
ncbi:hypothetical protein CPB83DRAFT_841563 [Crepidotus variabilis]|uniref:Uncharacterized protein n=1 Tax=Crepidotus variabilis TaxID=179855 RepID=A0A9P6EUV5_9AGAR|nr:hypothetical protein CPB83DRAFT_841563 [Crepidotus variabilis]